MNLIPREKFEYEQDYISYLTNKIQSLEDAMAVLAADKERFCLENGALSTTIRELRKEIEELRGMLPVNNTEPHWGPFTPRIDI
jgi:hypothetical protein